VTINMAGHHNVQNSLAAIAVLDEIGVDILTIIDLLKSFNGVKRRFTPVSDSVDFLVIDDYAHHPTEIKAVLKAARSSFADKQIRVLFQPHRFTRIRDLMSDFAESFTDCDSLVVTEIYPAFEQPILGVNAHVLIDKICSATKRQAHFAKDIDEGAKAVVNLTDKNDVVLILGAGSITHAGPMVVTMLNDKFGATS
jgi:UDP-N-acetylmuramate--alanine ligase